MQGKLAAIATPFNRDSLIYLFVCDEGPRLQCVEVTGLEELGADSPQSILMLVRAKFATAALFEPTDEMLFERYQGPEFVVSRPDRRD